MRNLLFATLLTAFSFNGFSFYRIECGNTFNELPDVKVTVELFGTFKKGTVDVKDKNETKRYTFLNLMVRSTRPNVVDYFANDFELEIDLWPDRRPMFARSYRSTLTSSKLGNRRYFHNLDCRFY